MLNRITTALFLVLGSASSQAALVYDNDITGADMNGIEVTATFSDGQTETISWAMQTEALGTSGNTIIDHEGFSGGVFGNSWSLTQQGYTLGNFDDSGNVYGAWSFEDSSSDNSVKSITINTGNTGIVFDTQTIDSLDQDTNGSGQGREAFAFIDMSAEFDFDIGEDGVKDYTAEYTQNILQELYRELTIELDVPGTDFSFLADTDLQREDDGTSDTVLVIDDTVTIANPEALNATIAAAAAEITALEALVPPGATPEQTQTAIDNAAANGNAVAQAIQGNADLVAAIAAEPALLTEASSFDITSLPDANVDQQVIEIIEEILEQQVKEEWTVSGNGDIDIEIDRDTGEVAVALTVANEGAAGEALEFSTLIDTALDDFFINFNLGFETATGSLDLSLNGLFVATFAAVDYQTLTNVSYLVSDDAFFGLTDAVLQYSLFPGSPSSAQLSNINVSFLQDNTVTVPEPTTFFLLMSGLLGLVIIRKKVTRK